MSIRTANPGEFLTADDVKPTLDADTFSVVDRHSFFDGTFRSDRDLRIEGDVKGTIECRGTLFVAQGATVTAEVEAEHITVAGNLNGEIRCRGRLHMMPSGRVRGKVTTETLVINEGAYYEGQLEMAAPEERENETTLSLASGRATTTPIPLTANGGGDHASSQGSAPTTFIRRLGGPETPWDNRSEDKSDEGASPPAPDEE